MVSALKVANLALAFLLELAALAAFATWGFNTSESAVIRIVVGVGTPLLAAVLWGIFAAPNSKRRLRGLAYLIFKIVFFALAVIVLIAAGSPSPGALLGVLFVVNLVLGYVWQQE